jgi:hypothetical protein
MIKSQDDLNTCNDGHRSSSVLLKTVEKCERLEQELTTVLTLLLKVSPKHESYVRANFPNYFKELNDDKAR